MESATSLVEMIKGESLDLPNVISEHLSGYKKSKKPASCSPLATTSCNRLLAVGRIVGYR